MKVKDGIKKVSLFVERENGETTTFDGIGIIGSIITEDDKDDTKSVTAIAGSFSKTTLLYGIGTQMEGVAMQLAQNGTPIPVLRELFHGMVEMTLDSVEKKTKAAAPSREQATLMALAMLLQGLGKKG